MCQFSFSILRYVSVCLLCFFFLLIVVDFLSCVSSLISHRGFEFLFVYFMGKPILSHTNFVLSSISLFYSVMFFVEICANNLSIFWVSLLTVFQSWFLSDRNEVFFSDLTLLIISILFSCITLCSVLFGCGTFLLLSFAAQFGQSFFFQYLVCRLLYMDLFRISYFLFVYFQRYFWFPYPKHAVREGCDYVHLMYLFLSLPLFKRSFSVIFIIHS